MPVMCHARFVMAAGPEVPRNSSSIRAGGPVGGERQVAHYHSALSVRVTTSQGAVRTQMQKEVEAQWVLLRSA